jgi:heterodisulfide reductase subunit A-like polyferredoxin
VSAPQPTAASTARTPDVERFDLAVIGGGIHGVGVLQAAAAAGLSAILLEERAIAAGTSSRSSKLIHGVSLMRCCGQPLWHMACHRQVAALFCAVRSRA